MTSTLFFECIDRKLLAGAIADLIQRVSAFPVQELKKLPKFSLEDYKVPHTDTADPLHIDIGGEIYKNGNEYASWTWNKKAWSGNQNAIEVQTDRQTLLDFLRNVEKLYQGYRHLLQEEFQLALIAFLNFPGFAKLEGTVFASPGRLTAALTDSTLVYYLKKDYSGFPENPWGGEHAYDPETDDGSPYAMMRHYLKFTLNLPSGNVLSSWGYALADQITTFFEGLKQFYDFHLPMLRAESHQGLGNTSTADQIYQDLLSGTPGKSEGFATEFLTYIALSAENNEFVRLKKAFNYLAWGDRNFAQAHGLASVDEAALVQSAKSKYEAAVQLLVGLYPTLDHDIQQVDAQIAEVETAYQSAINALEDVPTGHGAWGLTPSAPTGAAAYGVTPPAAAREIIAHAKAQLLKIAGHMNYLGYHDAHVPSQRYTFLWGRAREYADLAIEAEMRYLHFRHEAEAEELRKREIAQEAQLAGYPKQIADIHWATEEARLVSAARQILEIDRKLAELREPDIWGLLFGYAEMWGNIYKALAKDKPDALEAVKAMASWFRGNFKEQEKRDTEIKTLLAQKEVLNVEKTVTARQRLVAALEQLVAQMRAQQVREEQEYLEAKELNSDTYHSLAAVLKRINRTYLEAAIRMAYLAERALNFETGAGEIRAIRFDYYRPGVKDMMAGDLLKQSLMLIDFRRSLALTQRSRARHIISLRQDRPFEFYELTATGSTSFATTLYEFDKRYPGTYGHRLLGVEVIVHGVVGPSGFTGSLTNRGIFQVRTLQGTLSADRLLPTQTQWKSAYKEFLRNGTSCAEVGGVRSYQLPESRLILTQYDRSDGRIALRAESEVRDVFEDYGVAGLWHLELPLHLNDADYKYITDIDVVLDFDADYDAQLEKKMTGYRDESGRAFVKGLIRKYEEEYFGGSFDRIGMLSLRTTFPKEFTKLAQGEMTFALSDHHFPHYMAAKFVKKVIVLARDTHGSGIAGLNLHVQNNAGFDVELTTLRDGLTEDLHSATLFASQVNRTISLTGKWKISTPAHGAGTVDDLFFFFWYGYEERTAPA